MTRHTLNKRKHGRSITVAAENHILVVAALSGSTGQPARLVKGTRLAHIPTIHDSNLDGGLSLGDYGMGTNCRSVAHRATRMREHGDEAQRERNDGDKDKDLGPVSAYRRAREGGIDAS